jgi:uncharacterized cupin superfamily protein
MRHVNIADPKFVVDPEDPPGFRTGMFRLGKDLGAKRTGTTVYEIPPGEALCPYHYEYAEEEWLMVLSGRPTIRHGQGRDTLVPFDVAFFTTGPAGAHQVLNETDEPVRVLMWSEIVIPAATVYPDSDKVGIWTGNPDDDGLFRRGSKVDYFDGETSSG